MNCSAKTKGGAPCQRSALSGQEVCHAHSGAKVGRPSALTPEVHERLVQVKRHGCPDWVAAQLAGISETTLYAIKQTGRAEESGAEHELVEALERAEAETYLHGLVSWRKGMTRDWRAGKAYVEHQDRKHASAARAFGAREEGAEEGPRRLDTTELTGAQLDYLEELVDDDDKAEEG